MSTNNQILISEIIKRDSSENPQYKNEDSFFEFFASQQVLKKYDLSDEEIEQHLTGKMCIRDSYGNIIPCADRQNGFKMRRNKEVKENESSYLRPLFLR